MTETGDDFSPGNEQASTRPFFFFLSRCGGDRECHSSSRRWRRRPFLVLLRTRAATLSVFIIRKLILLLVSLALLLLTRALFSPRNPLPFPPPPPLLIRIPQLVLVPLERHHVRIDPERRAVDLEVRRLGGVEEPVAFPSPVGERDGGSGGGSRARWCWCCSRLCRSRS